MQTTATKKKISVNLSDEAAAIVDDLSNRKGITTSDVIRRALSLYRAVDQQLEDGSEIQFLRPSGVAEKVHILFPA